MTSPHLSVSAALSSVVLAFGLVAACADEVTFPTIPCATVSDCPTGYECVNSVCRIPFIPDAGDVSLDIDFGDGVNPDVDLDDTTVTDATATDTAEPEPVEYVYVALLSTAQGPDAIETNTPGADFDAIEIATG